MKLPTFEPRHAWALMLIGGLLASGLGVLLGVEIGGVLEERAAIEAEFRAIDTPRLLIEVVRLTQDHRDQAALVLGGNAAAEGPRRDRQRELDQAMAQFGLQLEGVPADPIARRDWSVIGSHWHALAQAVQARQLDAARSSQRHGELIQAQLDVHDRLLGPAARRADDWAARLLWRAPHLLAALAAPATPAIPAAQVAPAMSATAQRLQAEAEPWLQAARAAATDRAPARAGPGAGRAATPALQEALAGAQKALDLTVQNIQNIQNAQTTQTTQATQSAQTALPAAAGLQRSAQAALLGAMRTLVRTQHAALTQRHQELQRQLLRSGLGLAASLTLAAAAFLSLRRRSGRRVGQGHADATGAVHAAPSAAVQARAMFDGVGARDHAELGSTHETSRGTPRPASPSVLRGQLLHALRQHSRRSSTPDPTSGGKAEQPSPSLRRADLEDAGAAQTPAAATTPQADLPVPRR